MSGVLPRRSSSSTSVVRVGVCAGLVGAAFLAAAILSAAPFTARAQEAPPEEAMMKEKALLSVPVGGVEIGVEELLRDIGTKYKMVVAIDEALRGKKVKFVNTADINFEMLRSVFSMYGVEIIFENVGGSRIMKVFLQRTLPTAPFTSTPIFLQGEALPKTEQVVTSVYQVRYADANQIHAAIRGIMTRDPRRLGNIIYVQRSEVLIITDLTSNVEFFMKIAQALDQKLPEFTYKIVQVQYALADELAALVNALTRGLATSGGPPGAVGIPGQPAQPLGPGGVGRPGGVPGSEPQVVADPRTNKVVILALPNDVEAIERLLKELDVKVDAPPRHFHVVPLLNANAEEVAERLNALFSGQTSTLTTGGRQGTRTTPQRGGTRGGLSGGGLGGGLGGTTGGLRGSTRTGFGQQPGLSGQLGQQIPQTQPVSLAPGAVGPGGRPLNPGEQLIETRIVADPQTNSLLIQAAPDDFQEILRLLKELDKKRLRVFIEAQVWEISITDELRFTVDYAITDDAATNREPNPTRGQGFGSFGLLAPTVDPANPDTIQVLPNLTPPAPLSQGGLIFALTKGGFDQIPLILQALSTTGNSNILTQPFAIVNDNESALFSTLESQPFRVATAGTVAAFTGFDNAEAISELSITPRVSSGNTLTLDLSLTIESFTGASDPVSGAPPPKNGRLYQGIVTVPNRQYIVFGGLEKEREVESRRKIPFLGDIPYIGYLFGSTIRQKERTRIYVFVRPIIFNEEDFASEIRASKWTRDSIRTETILGLEYSLPVIPDEVLTAESGQLRSVLLEALGGPTPPFSDGGETKKARAAAGSR